jgi:hypothetical protein
MTNAVRNAAEALDVIDTENKRLWASGRRVTDAEARALYEREQQALEQFHRALGRAAVDRLVESP